MSRSIGSWAGSVQSGVISWGGEVGVSKLDGSCAVAAQGAFVDWVGGVSKFEGIGAGSAQREVVD